MPAAFVLGAPRTPGRGVHCSHSVTLYTHVKDLSFVLIKQDSTLTNKKKNPSLYPLLISRTTTDKVLKAENSERGSRHLGLACCSQPGVTLPLRETSNDIWRRFWSSLVRGRLGMGGKEARDDAKHAAMHRTAPHDNGAE